VFVSEIKVSKVELAQDIYELADPAKLVQSFVRTSEVAKEQNDFCIEQHRCMFIN